MSDRAPHDPARRPESLHELGVEAANQGRLDEAAALLERAVAENPLEPGYHSNLGSVLQALGRWDQAARAYERAVALGNQRLGFYHYNLGTVLQSQGKLEDAERAYRRALEHHPELVQALDNLGTVLQHQGKLDDAEAAYRRATRAQPDNAWAHCNLGSVLCAAGKLGDAEAAYRRAVELAPTEAKAHMDLGTCLHLQGKHEDAVAAYGRAAELAPKAAEAHRLLGTALLAAGRAEEAEAAHRRALSLIPETSPARADALGALGATLTTLGRFDDATAAFERATRLRPEWAQSHYNLGAVLHRCGHLERALSAYRAALERAPEHREALANLAEVLRRLGRVDQALDAYREVLAGDPDNAAARHMIAALSGQRPATAPAEYVRAMFDDYAPRFDQHLVGELGYRVPELMRSAIREADARARFARALDLGCGTGLVAGALRDMAGELHGVDLSAEMVARARDKNLYDALHQGELVAFLRDAPGTYELMTAADVLIYLGDLEPVLAAARARLAPGGLFALSLERNDARDGDSDYALRPTGRFAHGRAYVHRLARDHGFAVAVDRDITARLEHGEPVPGMLMVLRRT